jgi:protease-4
MRPAKNVLLLMLVLGLVPLSQASAQPAANTAAKPSKAVIPVFSFNREITESPRGEELFAFGPTASETLKDLVARMKKVRDDKQVKAVVLLGGGSLGLARTEEVRQVLEQIKAAGKEVHAHLDHVSTSQYALVSCASSISVVPTGMVWITGFHAETPYLRGLLDLLSIRPDFFTCGAYKSAAEMFMRKGPSPEASQMQNWLLDSTYETYLGLVAKGRRVSPEMVRLWIDGAPYSAERAKALGIIDKVQFAEDFVADLKAKYGADVKWDKRYGKTDKLSGLDLSSPLGLLKMWMETIGGPSKKKTGKDAVAIVYVDGPILPGEGESSPFDFFESIAYSTPIRKALDEVAEDSSVKAVVLRVDSPGGSAVASEIILNATKRVKAKKAFVVSMGRVAGSGGYYVACGADTIFADASTITASIGVVSGKFATTGMWNKVGIDWHSSKRGAMADILSSDHVFTPDGRARLQGYMDEVYGVFKKHVTDIRGSRLKKPIDELAGGRVFTGKQALDLGLVDKIGTLDDAIQSVAKQANLKDYEVRVVPRPKSFLEVLLSDLSDRESESQQLSTGAGAAVPSAVGAAVALPRPRKPNTLLELAMPMLNGIEPTRLQAIKAALGRMSLLQQERVVLMMPEFVLGSD